MSTDEALVRLGRTATEAVCGALERLAPGQVMPGEVELVGGESHPLDGVPAPAVATFAPYAGEAAGGILLVMPVAGARRLAAAVGGTEPDPSAEPSELSAVAEALSSAAAATAAVLGTDVEIGACETRSLASAVEAIDPYARTPHTTRAEVTICGEPCRLVQLVPEAFVARMTRTPEGSPSLAGITVRVCAELGRAQMASAQIVGLPAGAVVELDRQADEPIDLYVNGRPFATGRLMVVDGSDWAVRIETILDR